MNEGGWHTLREFQNLSGLSDRALLHLLRENLLPCRVTAEGVQVDVAQIDLQTLAGTVLSAYGADSGKNMELETLVYAALSRHLAAIVSDALQRYQETVSDGKD